MATLTDEQRFQDWQTLLALRATRTDSESETSILAIAALAVCERLNEIEGKFEEIEERLKDIVDIMARAETAHAPE